MSSDPELELKDGKPDDGYMYISYVPNDLYPLDPS